MKYGGTGKNYEGDMNGKEGRRRKYKDNEGGIKEMKGGTKGMHREYEGNMKQTQRKHKGNTNAIQ